MENKEKVSIGCVQLLGELHSWGRHIYLPKMGVTLCGCFTVDYDKKRFKDMPKDLPSEYENVEWDITCKKCLEMSEMFDNINKAKQATYN